MLRTLEDEGVIRETEYWLVIKDLHDFEQMKRNLKGREKAQLIDKANRERNQE